MRFFDGYLDEKQGQHRKDKRLNKANKQLIGDKRHWYQVRCGERHHHQKQGLPSKDITE